MPDNMDDMMKKLQMFMGHHKQKVVKKMQPTEEEVLELMALKGFEENAKKQLGVWEAKKKLFWAKIELRTGEVTRSLHWNDKDQVIEVLECDHSDNGGAADDGFES